MDKQQEQLETLKEIRSLMERSSRFISLSGLSGVIAGLAAIAGVVIAYWQLGLGFNDPGYYRSLTGPATFDFLVVVFALVLIVALLAATLLSMKNAKQHSQPIWDATAKRLLINLAIPLVTGGVFCLILLYHELLPLIAPATLVFYGLALLNASKYTFTDMQNLGILQIIIGLIASVVVEYGLLFWALGFGLLHIIYGITMYYKYEK